MTAAYPKQLFRKPGPYGLGDRSYAVAGAADEAEEAALVERGWTADFDALWLDHDGDGKPGGSKAPEGDLKALRAEYQDKTGKRAFPGWDEAEIRRRMA